MSELPDNVIDLGEARLRRSVRRLAAEFAHHPLRGPVSPPNGTIAFFNVSAPPGTRFVSAASERCEGLVHVWMRTPGPCACGTEHWDGPPESAGA